ncbi:MAG: hypothetical protein M1828_002120 [Chrysothrix sp. TS-e1954]|nr:MAG: hypothetical protein M1828_002120 [Chrysothrix sp. TS-e1954]
MSQASGLRTRRDGLGTVSHTSKSLFGDSDCYSSISQKSLFGDSDCYSSISQNHLSHHGSQDTAVASPVEDKVFTAPLPFRERRFTSEPSASPFPKTKRQSSKSFSNSGFGSRVRRASSSFKHMFNPGTNRMNSDRYVAQQAASVSTAERPPTRPGFLRRPKTAVSSQDIVTDTATRIFEPPPLVESMPRTRDSSRGAAARQSARDYGKLTTPIPVSRHDSGTFHVRPRHERESTEESAVGSTRPSVEGSSDRYKLSLKDPLTALPEELASLTLSFLPNRSLADAKLVCRAWCKLADDPVIWRDKFYRIYGYPSATHALPAACGGHGLGKINDLDQPWMKMLKVRNQIEKNWQTGRASVRYLYGHTDSVYCVQFDEDKIVTGSRDRTIRVWDTLTGNLRVVIGSPSVRTIDIRYHATALARSPIYEAHPFPANDNPGIQVLPREKFDFYNQGRYHTPRYYHRASILCLQYDDQHLITGSSDTSLIVWDIKTWQPLHRLEQHKSGVLDIAFDARKIVSCSKDGSICIWARHTGTLLTQISGHRGPVNAVQLRGDLIVSASGEGCAKLWQISMPDDDYFVNPSTVSATCIRDFWSKDRGLACVECSPNGQYILAGGNDHVIYRFSVDALQPARHPVVLDPLPTPTTYVSETIQMRGHTSLVRSLYLDHANKRIISGSYDLSLRVWDFETGKQIMKLENWASSWGLAAKGDWRRVVGASQDGRVGVVDFGGGVEGVEVLAG